MRDLQISLENQNETIIKGRENIINQVVRNCHHNLVSKYSNQREYFHMELMNRILDNQKNEGGTDFQLPPQTRIKTMDLKFNDEYQYLTKYYGECASTIEMTELCDYYKYYLQDPIIMTPGFFNILYCYNEKKKEIIYKKIKRAFNFQESGTPNFSGSLLQTEKDTLINSMNNVLAGISISQTASSEKDESICFINLHDKFIKTFGKSLQTNFHQIDKTYNFTKKIQIEKIVPKIVNTFHLAKGFKILSNEKKTVKRTILESTNSSSSNFQSNMGTPNSNNFYPQKIKRKQFLTNQEGIKIKKNQKTEESLEKPQRRIMQNPYRNSCQQTKRAVFQSKRGEKGKKKLRRRSCDLPFQELQQIVFEKALAQKICQTELRQKDKPLKKERYLKIYDVGDKIKRKKYKRGSLNSCQNIIDSKLEYVIQYKPSFKRLNVSLDKDNVDLLKNRKSTQFFTNKQKVKKHIQFCKGKIRQEVQKILKTEQTCKIDFQKNKRKKFIFDEIKNKDEQLIPNIGNKKQTIYQKNWKNQKLKSTIKTNIKTKLKTQNI